MIRKKVDGQWVGHKVSFYAGEQRMEHENGRAVVHGLGIELEEIEINEKYWCDRNWGYNIRGYYDKDEGGKYVYDSSYPGFRDLLARYFIDKKFHDGVKQICAALGIGYDHAQNLMVPLSDMYMSRFPKNTEYMDGFREQADQLVELLLRLEHPGTDPDPKRKKDERRDYYPIIRSIRIETGYMTSRSTRSGIRRSEKDGSYNFSHERLTMFIRQLVDRWIGSEDYRKQLAMLIDNDLGLGDKFYILSVYDYLILNGVFNHKPNAKGSKKTVNNDASRKTAYLIESAKLLHEGKKVDGLVADIKTRHTKDLTNQYRRTITYYIEKLHKN